MRQRAKGASLKPNPISSATNQENSGGEGENSLKDKNVALIAKRSSYVVFTLFVLVIYGAWGVYHYQFESLPVPLALEHVGKRGFSEHEAMKHVEALTQLGPHTVGSDALESAVKYVTEAAEIIKKTAHWEVNVEVDLFHVKSGANNMVELKSDDSDASSDDPASSATIAFFFANFCSLLAFISFHSDCVNSGHSD
ncbi:uncharacterized protein LOC130998621 [Salvia miltiorrhiza]|uniref:uncharacterized protein LOC130998621 n=1 Tax=Salvia miltiorrhiza TaxID=226208 RepID=UPI0025AD99B5|nr:uncharacterized protein LOC130998621 [Salvia miltiorrhiza]